jgi:arylsulfatase A-like enzyme
MILKVMRQGGRRILLAAGCLAAACYSAFALLTARPHMAPPYNPALPQHPNVLLITVDTLRADYVSASGSGKTWTPNIDALAWQGAIFTNAFCDVTWTTPSMASVMTGTYAVHHGLRTTYEKLAPENVTLAEVLHGHGYQTGAIIGSFPLDSIYGLDQGFETYDDHFTAPLLATGKAVHHIPSQLTTDVRAQALFNASKQLNDSRRPDPDVTTAAVHWLRAARTPFFLWVHYFGAHALADKRWSAEKALHEQVDGYPHRVTAVDGQIGVLINALAELGHRPDTLVVFHADHGESLGEHFDVGHGRNLYEPALRVPLIFSCPGKISPGRRVTGMARNIDIFPTVLDVVGIRYDGQIDGHSLLPLIQDGKPEGASETYAETEMPRHPMFADLIPGPDGKFQAVGVVRRGIRTPEWKYVRTEPAPLLGRESEFVPSRQTVREELYDLGHDPGEINNVATREAALTAAFRARLAGYTDHAARAAPPVDANRSAVKERLRVLGYSD